MAEAPEAPEAGRTEADVAEGSDRQDTKNAALTGGIRFELSMRLELTTSSLPRKCSTTELRQHFPHSSGAKVHKKNEMTKKKHDFPDFFLSLLPDYNKNLMKRILIVGAGGQIGSELTVYLRKIYGNHNVVATDMRECKSLGEDGPFEVLNALDATAMASVVARYHVDTIFNLVALLSAVGERNPQMAWNVNMGALNNSLEVARQHHCALFTPSSIGAFGPTSPKDKTPQDTIMQPTTIYGVCKVTGELLGNYYHHKFGVDTRSVRFPGIISNVTLPGGGTTDYAVEIYYEAIRSGRFTCPVPGDVYMDMIYMPDALRACVELMEADPSKLVHRNSFNLASMSFTPEIIYAEIRKRLPDFTMTYDIDPVKREIAESWPNSLDDTCAREEWGWKPEWDLSRMTDDMLAHIRAKLAK